MGSTEECPHPNTCDGALTFAVGSLAGFGARTARGGSLELLGRLRAASELAAAVQLHLPGQLLPDGQEGAGPVSWTGQQLLKASPFFIPERKEIRAGQQTPCLPHGGRGKGGYQQ